MNQINRWKSDGNGPSSDLLRTFCTVVELGNVTKAAARLGRTQSAISVQLRKLEEALGVRLLERGARGVVPTREGEKLQGLARDTVDRVDRIGTLFRRPLSGKIRVGIPDDYNETILERALARFVKRHAQVEVFIRAGCTAGFPAAIRDNTLDIALYGAEPLSEDQVVFSEPTVWAAAKDFDWDWAAWHAANNKQETEGEATGSLPLVLFDRPCGWRHVARDSLNAADLPWRVVYLSENFLSVRTA
ncbi:MAG: LysR family transcriptional regulator, partial [Pseudomonadota bacterium]